VQTTAWVQSGENQQLRTLPSHPNGSRGCCL